MYGKYLKYILLPLVWMVAAYGMEARAYVPGDTTVQLVVFYPGPDIYELEGHAVIRVKTPLEDYAVSYGTFDFEQPNFVYRFVKGETDYCASVSPFDLTKYYYASQGRKISAHTLDLTSAEKARIINLLTENLKPENRVYRYNYVKDNCSTRPLAMVEKAIGDSVILGPSKGIAEGSQTFRTMMEQYHANYPWYQFGIDLALGPGLDYKLNERDKTYAPEALDQMMPGSRTAGGRELISASEILYSGHPGGAQLPATPWYLTPGAVFSLLLLICLVVSLRNIRRGRVSRWLHSLFYLLLGINGCVMAFLIFISVHEATSPNWLFIWINPVCLFPAILIWLKKCKKAIYIYQIANFALLIGFAVSILFGAQTINPAMWLIWGSDVILSMSLMFCYRVESKRITSR